jgi:hypothetical protein
MATKYQKAKIYRIVSPSKNLVYYGSTIQTLTKRLSLHLTDYKNSLTNCSSKLVMECGDYKIELVENYPCDTRKELCKKEGEYIRSNVCVNKQIAGRTIKEYLQDNLEKIREYKKNYIIENKDKMRDYRVTNRERIYETHKLWRDKKKIKLESKNNNSIIL